MAYIKVSYPNNEYEIIDFIRIILENNINDSKKKNILFNRSKLILDQRQWYTFVQIFKVTTVALSSHLFTAKQKLNLHRVLQRTQNDDPMIIEDWKWS